MCKTISDNIDIQIIANAIYINGSACEDAKLETIEYLDHNRAYRIICCNGVYYRQNGYYEAQRGKAPIVIFHEQEWYKVKPEKRIAYVYE